MKPGKSLFITIAISLIACFFSLNTALPSGFQDKSWSRRESAIFDRIHKLRSLADPIRARTTKQLALDIRALSGVYHKLDLAFTLATLSTEGDFGQDTLQEVATTLADALREDPSPMMDNEPAPPYIELAQLAHYEHVNVSLDGPQYTAALAKLDADDQSRRDADFTLSDLQGKSWSLKDLHGKVVMVNFWATWCGPCRKEIPDLEALYHQFKNDGLVILGISDEEAPKVKELLATSRVTYPILLDPGRKVNDLFHIEGIPKSFVYDRDGRLVAQAIDMRTRKQFLEMLAQAGLH